MATKKVKNKVENEATEKQIGICINCSKLVTGWQGPICGAPNSEWYQKRVRDDNTCNLFQVKGIPVVEIPDDGLYDPDIPPALPDVDDV